MDILYSAYVGSTSSWSIVARNVISNLLTLGNKIRVSSTNGWENVPSEIVSLASTQLTDPVFLGYTVPHRLPAIPQKSRFLIYNYESSLLPSGWASIINQHAQLVFPASAYAANILRDNGVISDKIVVLPYGVDTTVFSPNVPPAIPRDKFNFLYCAIPHVRKGIDLLLRAYYEAFDANDAVRLILKTSRRTAPPQSFVIDIDKTIANAKALFPGKNLPEVMVIDHTYHNLSSLYTSASAYVAPSRSEGFGMTPLEAMACGVPVIASAYGGHLDFLNSDNSYPVLTREVEATHQMQYWQYQRGAKIGEPDVQDLRDKMIYVYSNYESTVDVIRNGLATVKKYNWKDIIVGLDATMRDSLGVAKSNKIIPPIKGKVVTTLSSAAKIAMTPGNANKIDRANARKILKGSAANSLTTPGQHSVVVAANSLPAKATKQKILQQAVVLNTMNISPKTPSTALPKPPLPINQPTTQDSTVVLSAPRDYIFLYNGITNDKYSYIRALSSAIGNTRGMYVIDGASSPSSSVGVLREVFSSRSIKYAAKCKAVAAEATVVVHLSDLPVCEYYLRAIMPAYEIYYITDLPIDRVNFAALPRGKTTVILNALPENHSYSNQIETEGCVYVDTFDVDPETLVNLQFTQGMIL